MASRGAPQPRQGISAILNNIQVIKDQFRKQQKRVDLFEEKLKKSHRSFGNEIFKVRHNQYFDDQKQHRYKTPHLKLREIHRSLRGRISRTQKEKDKHDLLHPPAEGPYLPTYNDIKTYPDTRHPMEPDQMIQNVNNMIEEEAKYQDDEWVNREMSQSGSSQSDQVEQTIFKKEDNHTFQFSLADKLKSALAERVSKQLELEELEKLKMHHLHVQDMLTKDVNDLYNHRQFKQVMSEGFNGSMLNDVATRLMQQFKAQLKDGVQRPVPNLGHNLKSIRADSKEMSDLFESLLWFLRSSDREQYLQLRDGKRSLNQLCRNLCQQQFGKTYTVMDDITDKGELLKQPSKYVVAACNQLQLETQLFKHAQKRGVDKKLLSDTAPTISLQAKCIRSIHSKPARRRTKQKVDHVDKAVQVLLTKETQDEAQKLELIQRQAEKWGNFQLKKGIMTKQETKMGKQRRYEQAKSIESRFSFKLPQELHESLTRDYKTEYSRQIKVKTKRAAALRPWRVKKSQTLTDADVLKSQTIAAPDKITYEAMHDSFKEKLENCQEALFLKRIYEDTEGCVLEMPIRFAFSADRPTIRVQPQSLASVHVDMVKNPSEVMLVESDVDQINEASKEHCQTLGEEDLSPKGPYITAEGPQTVEASCESFQKMQLKKIVDLSPLHSVRVKENLQKKPCKTAVVLKAKAEPSSSTEDEIIQSTKLLNCNSIVKQLLEFENQEHITERFRPKSAICPTSAVRRHRLLVTRKTELQCNNIADLKVEKDHQQFLIANMRQGAYSGSLIQNSFANTSKNPTPKQAAELIVPSRHIVMQGQMMDNYRPSTVRPRTVLDRNKPESMTRVLTQARNTPLATSSIKDYEMKTSQVPSSVVNWYNTNIVRSHDQRSPAVAIKKQVIVRANPKTGRLLSAKNGDLQKTLGSYDSNISLENSSAPFVKGFVIKNSETPSLREEELVTGSAAVTAVTGFNWLTGAKMSIGKNINIPSRLRVSDPILKKKKRILQQICTLNDFADYPVAKDTAHLLQIDHPDHSTELKIKQSLNLGSENQSVIELC